MILLPILLFFTSSCAASIPTDKSFTSEGKTFRFELLAERSNSVWGFDFLKDGRMIFTERAGAIGILDLKTKAVKMVEGAPKVWAEGQGGMLDIRVQPRTQKIFLTFSQPKGGGATTALASADLSGESFRNFKILVSATAANDSTLHFGSRIEFDGKGHVFFTVGDRGERDQVQNPASHIGKLLRVKEDGSAPSDNPFFGKAGHLPEIWSLGHRSPQGLALRPGTEELWEAEMGPRGGDEVNFIEKGSNYGWPEVTYGREYYGPKIGQKTKAGMKDPVVHWVPSISPSALTFYTGDKFPRWKGNAFLANLSGSHVRRLVLNGRVVVKQEVLLEDMARFRSVRTGPDGFLYLSTDDGQIGRLVP